MRRLHTLLTILRRVAARPALLNRVLDAPDEHRMAVQQRYGLPNGLPFTDPAGVGVDLQEEVTPFAFLEGGSMVTDLALLQGVARSHAGCRYFEIGTWRGESVANVAPVADACVTLDLPADELLRRGASEAYIAQQGMWCKDLPNVTCLHGDSRTMDLADHEGRYHVVFVDGDHHHASVVCDTRTAFRLVAPGGTIIWHDAGRDATDQRWEVVHGILEGCPPEQRDNIRRVAHTLCAIHTTRPLPALPPGDHARARRVFSVTLRMVS